MFYVFLLFEQINEDDDGDWTCWQVSRAALVELDQLELPVQLDELDHSVNLE